MGHPDIALYINVKCLLLILDSSVYSVVLTAKIESAHIIAVRLHC